MHNSDGTQAISHNLHNLDFLRIVASICVIFYHYVTYLDKESWAFLVLNGHIRFRLWVDLFFILSGFVIAYVYADSVGKNFSYRTFLQKRVARLFPLHIVTLLFYVALGLATMAGVSANSTARYDWSCLAPNLLLLHSTGICSAVSFNTPSWSISAELGMYAIFPLLAVIGKYCRGAILFALVAFCIIAFETWSNLSDEQYWLFRASQGGVLRALPSFTLGIVLFYNRGLLSKIPYAPQTYILSLTAFTLLIFTDANYLLLFFLVCSVVTLCIATDVQNRAPRLIIRYSDAGKFTYSTYLLHMPVASVMMTIGNKLLGLKGFGLNLWVGATFIVMLCASWVSYHYFEMPARRWIGQLGHKKPSISPSTGSQN